MGRTRMGRLHAIADTATLTLFRCGSEAHPSFATRDVANFVRNSGASGEGFNLNDTLWLCGSFRQALGTNRHLSPGGMSRLHVEANFESLARAWRSRQAERTVEQVNDRKLLYCA